MLAIAGGIILALIGLSVLSQIFAEIERSKRPALAFLSLAVLVVIVILLFA
jgi:hypothetical protein